MIFNAYGDMPRTNVPTNHSDQGTQERASQARDVAVGILM